jgi:putative flavoprotein involved in K+ transport
MQLEGDKHGLPSKNEIAAYLKKYVERFEIPIQLRTGPAAITRFFV